MLFTFILLILVVCCWDTAASSVTSTHGDGYCAYTISMRFCKQIQHSQTTIVKQQAVTVARTQAARYSLNPITMLVDWILAPLQQKFVKLEHTVMTLAMSVTALDKAVQSIERSLQAIADDVQDLKDSICDMTKLTNKLSQNMLGTADTRYDWLRNATSAGAVWTAIERDLLDYVLRDCDSSQQPPASLTTIGTYRELLGTAAAAAVDSSSGVLARLEHVRATEGMQEVEQMLEDWERCAKEGDKERSYEGLRVFLQGLDSKQSRLPKNKVTVAAPKDL